MGISMKPENKKNDEGLKSGTIFFGRKKKQIIGENKPERKKNAELVRVEEMKDNEGNFFFL